MTLTALMPSLRRILPDPMARDKWPEFCTVSTTDVTIAGVSLVRLVEWCSTPCVHTAAAVIPGTNGRPSDSELASVVVSKVTLVDRSGNGSVRVTLDANLGGCTCILSEARLIGRASTAHLVVATLDDGRELQLPADLLPGDLVVVPCLGVTARHDVLTARQPVVD